MKSARITIFGLSCAFLCTPAMAAPHYASEPVAVVYKLAGHALVAFPAQERQPLRLFDYLPKGARIEVEPGSRLALAFVNGRRYELGEGSRITLGPDDLASRIGPVRPLPRVPPLPKLAPIVDDDHPGSGAGAFPIRGQGIAILSPRDGAATSADATVLRFEPVDGGEKYRVEVRDQRGNLIFASEATGPVVNLPAGVLQAGTRYNWTVRTIERAGPVARGDADFVTLAARIAKKREALRRAVEKAGDGALLALLADVDRNLGLLAEARDEFQKAVQYSPGDAALAANLAELERCLKEGA